MCLISRLEAVQIPFSICNKAHSVRIHGWTCLCLTTWAVNIGNSAVSLFPHRSISSWINRNNSLVVASKTKLSRLDWTYLVICTCPCFRCRINEDELTNEEFQFGQITERNHGKIPKDAERKSWQNSGLVSSGNCSRYWGGRQNL